VSGENNESKIKEIRERIVGKMDQTKDYARNNPYDKVYAEGQANGLRIAIDFIDMVTNSKGE